MATRSQWESNLIVTKRDLTHMERRTTGEVGGRIAGGQAGEGSGVTGQEVNCVVGGNFRTQNHYHTSARARKVEGEGESLQSEPLERTETNHNRDSCQQGRFGWILRRSRNDSSKREFAYRVSNNLVN